MECQISYNYCLKIINTQINKYIYVKDICGADLELLDIILDTKETINDIELICELFKTKIYTEVAQYSPRKFPVRFLYKLFKIYLEEIITKEYIDKVSWLKLAYYMQKSSFRDLSALEKIPMNKFLVMVDIHKEALEYAKSK